MDNYEQGTVKVPQEASERIKRENQSMKKNGRTRMDIRPSNMGRNAVLVAGGMLTATAVALSHGGGSTTESNSNPEQGIKVEAAKSVDQGNRVNYSPEQKNEDHFRGQEKVDQVIVQALVDAAPELYREKAKVSIPAVIDSLHRVGIDSPKVIAYLLATSGPESNLDLEMEEIDGHAQAIKHGYDGGKDFYGRGLMPLTHKYNYRDMSEWLPKYFSEYKGIDLVKNPDLARRRDISGPIAAVFMKEKGVAAAVEAGDLDHARELVYGKIRANDDYGQKVKEDIDNQYEKYLQAFVKREVMLASINAQLDRVMAR